MSAVLSGWKEIGRHLGSSVRTVQRWEQEFGLPIRRPTNGARHAVLAFTEDLDVWLRRQSVGGRFSELEYLRCEVVRLELEVNGLRQRLNVEAVSAAA